MDEVVRDAERSRSGGAFVVCEQTLNQDLQLSLGKRRDFHEAGIERLQLRLAHCVWIDAMNTLVSARTSTAFIHQRNVLAAEMASREMGGLSLADALVLYELLAACDPKRYERAALHWLQRFIDERLPPLAEVALAASALAELRHGRRAVGVEALRRVSDASALFFQACGRAASSGSREIAARSRSASRI
jgi:hypothetical protein